MPVGRTATRREVTALVLALGGVLAAVALGALVLAVARGGDVEVRLGSDVWEVGRAGRLADAIAEDGPFLVQDLSGGDRDIYVSHVGEDEDRGWSAFAARAAGADRRCSVVWAPSERVLRDPCDGSTYPSDGTGLEQYPVHVEDGEVIVDINRVSEAEPAPDVTDGVVQSGTPR